MSLLCFFVYCPATQTCSAPSLDGGYFVPVQEIYSHGTNLSYSCDNGLKPAAEGWWATSTCENATWTPKPQCIGKCFINIWTYFIVYCYGRINVNCLSEIGRQHRAGVILSIKSKKK